MITHTTCVVLKTVDFSESSKIATLLTKEHGKIGVMGKGAKRPKSKFRGLLETGNLLNIVYYYKESRSVQILSEAGYHRKTMSLRFDFEKMAVMMSALELVSQLLHDREVNKPIFTFTKNFLVWLNDTQIKPATIFPYIQIRLAELMGIGLQLKSDSASFSGMYLNIDSGFVSKQDASAYSFHLSKSQYHYVRLALQTHHSKIFSIKFQNGELKKLVTYLDRYLNYHLEGLRSRKSDAVFDQIFIS
jgi:DNA repair protein RecO (recombination protein O)